MSQSLQIQTNMASGHHNLSLSRNECSVLQIVIMMTPVRIFFKVRYQSWEEWLFALAAGAGSLPIALLTKLISKPIMAALRRHKSRRKSLVHPVESDSESPHSPWIASKSNPPSLWKYQGMTERSMVLTWMLPIEIILNSLELQD